MTDSVTAKDPFHHLAAHSLLRTKLFIPQASQLRDILPRPRLVEQLQNGLARKLTLISAPAGYGKTVLLAEWIPQSDSCVCWLALDETDNDFPRFFTYVIAALQGLKAEFGQGLLATIQSPQLPAVEGLMTALINEIAHTLDEFALVLDDYHVIQQPVIHSAIAFLLNHPPPNLHLIFTSRADPPLPLARLRARGEMTELRAADLRFTLEETTAFFHQIKMLPLPIAQIQELDLRTEGWGAGLHLAALSLQRLDATEIERFMHDFTGSHHNVFDYLAEEVLEQQPADVQRFLLHTAILSRFCGPLCDILIGDLRLETGDWLTTTASISDPQSLPPNLQSQTILESLEHANLFLVPLDNRRHWYRYHHLFADFLRNRLTQNVGKEMVQDLQRRASRWFEEQELLPEAVQHALATGDGVLAARLIESLARPMQLRGEMATLMGWLAALPEAVLRAQPQLGLIYVWGLATTGQLLAAEQWLQTIERNFATADDRSSWLGEVTVTRARIALIQGEYGRAVELARQALTYLPADQLLLRALTHVSLGSAIIALGDLETAGQSFTQASALYQAVGQPLQALLPLRQLARVLLTQGRLNQLEQVTREALRLIAGAEQRSPLVGYTYMSLGELCYERNDLIAADRYFTDGLALVELGSASDVLNLMNLVDAHLGVARLKQIQGDPQGALALTRRVELIWEQLVRAIQQRNNTEHNALPTGQAAPSARTGIGTLYLDRIAAFRVRLWLNHGDITAASQWAQSREWQLDGEINFLQEVSLIALARVLLAQGEPARALPLLVRLLAGTEAVGRMQQALELLLLQALALHALGQEAEALRVLTQALALAEPEGYIRSFVDEGQPMAALLHVLHARNGQAPYIVKLLAAFPTERATNKVTAVADVENVVPTIGNRQSPIASLSEQLTELLSEREVEVLQLMAQGLTNPEIGQHMIVSAQTVKVHTRNIYGKLGVNGRREAVAKARTLGLLP